MGARLNSEGGGTVTGTVASTIFVSTTFSGVDVAVGVGQHPANAAPAAVRALKRRKSRRLILLGVTKIS
jgi:hypothetical protein